MVVEVPGVGNRPPRKISKSLLVDVIQPRMAEILTMCYDEVKKSDYINLMTTGLVMTGGGSLLPGTIELAEDIFNMPVKLGVPGGFSGMVEEAEQPQCATGVGLLQYGVAHRGELGTVLEKSEANLFEAIKKRFRRWFGSVTVLG